MINPRIICLKFDQKQTNKMVRRSGPTLQPFVQNGSFVYFRFFFFAAIKPIILHGHRKLRSSSIVHGHCLRGATIGFRFGQHPRRGRPLYQGPGDGPELRNASSVACGIPRRGESQQEHDEDERAALHRHFQVALSHHSRHSQFVRHVWLIYVKCDKNNLSLIFQPVRIVIMNTKQNLLQFTFTRQTRFELVFILLAPRKK